MKVNFFNPIFKKTFGLGTNTDKAPTDNEITTTEKPRTTQATALSAEMIDNYGMVSKQRDPEIHFQFRDQVLNRDECFR